MNNFDIDHEDQFKARSLYIQRMIYKKVEEMENAGKRIVLRKSANRGFVSLVHNGLDVQEFPCADMKRFVDTAKQQWEDLYPHYVYRYSQLIDGNPYYLYLCEHESCNFYTLSTHAGLANPTAPDFFLFSKDTLLMLRNRLRNTPDWSDSEPDYFAVPELCIFFQQKELQMSYKLTVNTLVEEVRISGCRGILTYKEYEESRAPLYTFSMPLPVFKVLFSRETFLVINKYEDARAR